MAGSRRSPVSAPGGATAAGTARCGAQSWNRGRPDSRDIRPLRWGRIGRRVQIGHDQGCHFGRAADGVRAPGTGRLVPVREHVLEGDRIPAVLTLRNQAGPQVGKVRAGQQGPGIVLDGLHQPRLDGDDAGQEPRVSGAQAESGVAFLAQPRRVLVVDGQLGLDDLKRRGRGHKRRTVQRGDDVVSGIGRPAGPGDSRDDAERDGGRVRVAGPVLRGADPERGADRCHTARVEQDLVRGEPGGLECPAGERHGDGEPGFPAALVPRTQRQGRCPGRQIQRETRVAAGLGGCRRAVCRGDDAHHIGPPPALGEEGGHRVGQQPGALEPPEQLKVVVPPVQPHRDRPGPEGTLLAERGSSTSSQAARGERPRRIPPRPWARSSAVVAPGPAGAI